MLADVDEVTQLLEDLKAADIKSVLLQVDQEQKQSFHLKQSVG